MSKLPLSPLTEDDMSDLNNCVMYSGFYRHKNDLYWNTCSWTSNRDTIVNAMRGNSIDLATVRIVEVNLTSEGGSHDV